MQAAQIEESNKSFPFRIVEASSEDSNFRASELEQESGKGWHTAPDASYPQHLILQPLQQPSTASSSPRQVSDVPSLSKIQLLLHETRIPKKIELFVSTSRTGADQSNAAVVGKGSDSSGRSDDGNDSSSDGDSTRGDGDDQDGVKTRNSIDTSSLQFKRLGYIDIDDNEKTGCRARELKSIPLGNVTASFLKLVIHGCHDIASSNDGGGSSSKGASSMNPHGQVGIISISLFGTCRVGKGDLKINHAINNWSTTIQHSPELSVKKSSNSSSSSSTMDGSKILPLDQHLEKNNVSRNNGSNMKTSEKKKQVESAKNKPKDFTSFFHSLDWNMIFNPSEFNEGASRMKDLLSNIISLLKKVDETNLAIQDAVAKETYLEASKLKGERDAARKILLNAVAKMEGVVSSCSSSSSATKMISHPQNKVGHDDQNKGVYDDASRPHSSVNLRLDDLSLSTIRRVDHDDDPSVAMTMTSRTHTLVDRPIRPMKGSGEHRQHILADESPTTSEMDESEEDEQQPYVDENGKHPLEGVPNYLDLPTPEDILKSSGGPAAPGGGGGGLSSSLNSSINSHSSTDFSKLERILGPYLTRCFVSKSWALREAAMMKLSLILKDTIVGIRDDPESDDRSGWWDVLSQGLCIILERAMDDRIVQVFLTGLILLDDCITEFEAMKVSQRDTINLLSNVILNLVGKLGDGNPKVAEGSETALMSMALSDIVGPSYIGSQVMKQMSSKESKTAKSVARRCHFLKGLLEEFHSLAGTSVEKIMKFVHSFGFLHPQVEARDAAKSLASLLYLRDKKVVLSMMDGLSDRQVKEYKAAFAAAKAKEKGGTSPVKKNATRILSSSSPSKKMITQGANYPILRDDNDNDEPMSMARMTPKQEFPINGMEPLKTPGRRGRGRGRSRKLYQSTPHSRKLSTSAQEVPNRLMVEDILSDFRYD